MMPLIVHTVVSGSPLDGIRIYAVALAEARAARGRPTECFDLADPCWLDGTCDVVHVHMTDRLVDESRSEWIEFFDRVRRRRLPLVVTLHDIPQPEEGADRFARRHRATMALAGAADLVVVNSQSEQRRCRTMGIASSVVPHPIFPRPISTPSPTIPTIPPKRQTLVVAGFVHPGKGIAELVESLGDVRTTPLDGWQLRLVGEAPRRHHEYLRHVQRIAVAAGLRFHHTGDVSVDRWHRELAAAAIPIAPHLHCSASGSIMSWAANGRRPVVSDHPFTRELADERPGALSIVDSSRSWRGVLAESVHSGDRHLYDTAGWRTPDASVDAFDAAISPLVESWERTG